MAIGPQILTSELAASMIFIDLLDNPIQVALFSRSLVIRQVPFCCKCGRAPLVERVRFDFVTSPGSQEVLLPESRCGTQHPRQCPTGPLGSLWELGMWPAFHGDVLRRSKLAVLRLDLGSLQGTKGSSFLV